MTTTIKINSKSNSLDIIIAIVKMTTILTSRFFYGCYCGSRSAYAWLKDTHNFGNEEGDIHMTGWQYIQFLLGLTLIAFMLCISF